MSRLQPGVLRKSRQLGCSVTKADSLHLKCLSGVDAYAFDHKEAHPYEKVAPLSSQKTRAQNYSPATTATTISPVVSGNDTTPETSPSDAGTAVFSPVEKEHPLPDISTALAPSVAIVQNEQNKPSADNNSRARISANTSANARAHARAEQARSYVFKRDQARIERDSRREVARILERLRANGDATVQADSLANSEEVVPRVLDDFAKVSSNHGTSTINVTDSVPHDLVPSAPSRAPELAKVPSIIGAKAKDAPFAGEEGLPRRDTPVRVFYTSSGNGMEQPMATPFNSESNNHGLGLDLPFQAFRANRLEQIVHDRASVYSGPTSQVLHPLGMYSLPLGLPYMHAPASAFGLPGATLQGHMAYLQHQTQQLQYLIETTHRQQLASMPFGAPNVQPWQKMPVQYPILASSVPSFVPAPPKTASAVPSHTGAPASAPLSGGITIANYQKSQASHDTAVKKAVQRKIEDDPAIMRVGRPAAKLAADRNHVHYTVDDLLNLRPANDVMPSVRSLVAVPEVLAPLDRTVQEPYNAVLVNHSLPARPPVMQISPQVVGIVPCEGSLPQAMPSNSSAMTNAKCKVEKKTERRPRSNAPSPEVATRHSNSMPLTSRKATTATQKIANTSTESRRGAQTANTSHNLASSLRKSSSQQDKQWSTFVQQMGGITAK